MKKTLLSSVMTIGLLTPLLSATDANAAAGFLHKTLTCPQSGFVLLPPGSRIEISDVVVSADDVTDVVLNFSPGNVKFLTVYLGANETVAANFTGQLESADEQGIKVSCGGVAKVSVTIVGTEAF